MKEVKEEKKKIWKANRKTLRKLAGNYTNEI